MDTDEVMLSFRVAGEGFHEKEKMRQTGFMANQELDPKCPYLVSQA